MRFNLTVSIVACALTSAFAAPDIVLEGTTDTVLVVTKPYSGASIRAILLDPSDNNREYGLDVRGYSGYYQPEEASTGVRVKIEQAGTAYGFDADIGGGLLTFDARGFNANLSTDGLAYGAYLNASASSANAYGVYAEGSAGYGDGYGIYATASSAFGPAYAGYFDGNVTIEGNLAITGTCYPCAISDSRFKKNVREYQGGLDKVMALKPKSYEMKNDDSRSSIRFAKGQQIGLIAQEVEAVVPEVVHELTLPAKLTAAERKNKVKRAGETVKGVNYTALIPVMLKAIQEQQAEIEALRAQVKRLGG